MLQDQTTDDNISSLPVDLMGSFQKIGNFAFTGEDEGAEISAYDPDSQRLFVVAGTPIVKVLNLSNPTNITDTGIEIDLNNFIPDVAGANSVAVSKNGIVAVAVEADPTYNAGHVAFFDTDGTFLQAVTVGALPDMITFTPDGTKVLVANEGEPVETEQGAIFNPEGSIGIIDISNGVENLTQADVQIADFNQYDGREVELSNKGIRIFPGETVSQDVEPEYIAISEDGTTATVTLQENNALAVVDIATATVEDILPLGVKDHSQGNFELTQIELDNLLSLGTTPAGQEIKLGGFSGLWYAGEDETTGNLIFYTVPDRGPNPDETDAGRPFALPNYQARVVELQVTPDLSEIAVTQEIFLRREDGITPITGLPNLDDTTVDENPIDLFGNDLAFDALGGDLEGIAVDNDGNFWMVDEYRPAIYQFSQGGTLLNRYIPEGTAAIVGETEGTFGTETLPQAYNNRRSNRGFEAIAFDNENNIIYAFIQTPLANPDRETSDNSDVIRILGIDATTGEPVAEYVYLLEDTEVRPGGRVDKIGDAVYTGDGQFYVVERDAAVGDTAKKLIFEIDLTGATNVLGIDFGNTTLEQHTADELADFGIQAVYKEKVVNLPSLGYVAGDKVEGLTQLPDGSLAIINDNDFGLATGEISLDGSVLLNEEPTPITLGILSVQEGNQLDASDKDGGINLQNWPVAGIYMPDAIASFAVGETNYYITANEGDSRDEDARIADLTLDPDAFPDAATLQAEENLGRLEVSTIDGDLDGDGDYDKLFSYGARSFSIWDEFGNLVFDSGDDLAEIIATDFPALFNSEGSAASFDERSDNKGVEAEGVTVGVVEDKILAFIGLERVGGVMVYDVTSPQTPEFYQYIPNGTGDQSPEGLLFIEAENSPNGDALLVVSNEVSSTVTIYGYTV